MKDIRQLAIVAVLLLATISVSASKLVGLHVIDKDYLMVHLRDGEVHYRDSGTGQSAYLGHSFAEGDDTLLVFGQRVNTELAQQAAQWTISSVDDKSFASQQPLAVWRKSKPMNTDHTLKGELDHWLFLQLPQSMRQGCSYTVMLPQALGAGAGQATVCFDVWNTPSEAIHVNIIGYSPREALHAADLYQWLGDGGQRNYHDWEGRKVYLYNVQTRQKQAVGTVKFWKPATEASHEAGGKNLVGTDVWSADFRAARPGRYRLVIEGVGSSMDFDVANSVFHEPYRYSVRGYYYMRLGEPIDPDHVWPVPRQPQFIPETDPRGLTVYKTDLTPWSPEWRALRTDVWDEPHFKPALQSIFWQHRLPGSPVNTEVRGGHSDAFDWDRHLAHVSNIYDLLLPYLLTDGRLADDDLGIRESGNGIPDIIDEARNEVDFFLSIRDGEAYSQGVTNPSTEWTIMFQAGCTTMAAWANAANCAMLAEAFRVHGTTTNGGQKATADSLCRYYTDEAVRAFRFASRQDNQQLDDQQDVGSMTMRGRDFRQLAAAYLYNLTADAQWERIMTEESLMKRALEEIWAAAAYVTCPHERNFSDVYKQLLADVDRQADAHNVSLMAQRPSRRSANDRRWQTSQNLQLVMLAHRVATTRQRRQQLEHAMYTEAGWAMGRNPGNIVEMTGLGERHITDVYSTGRNDGEPGTHPGQTPFNGTETWSPNNGGDAQLLLRQCYPAWADGGWPRQESFFNQRYFWVNGEFTPRETMRGKMALLGYLQALSLVE